MIRYPKLKSSGRYRQVMDKFRGYNRNLRIGNGEFAEMENLTSDDYPVLSVRKNRGLVVSLPENGYSTGMLYAPDVGLFFTADHQKDHSDDEYGALYLLNIHGELTRKLNNLESGPKSLALIGKYLIIAPDMKWVELETWASGSMEENWKISSGTVTVRLCDGEGNTYSDLTPSPEPPANPGYHQMWLCNALGSQGLYKYEPATSQWVSVASTYVKLTGLGDHYFSDDDGITISGFEYPGLNGSFLVHRSGHGDLVIPGILYETVSQNCAQKPITLCREVPTLDFLVECGNRLWGCKADTNEIYACKLGDFHNWNCFQGLSTDSWVGNVGTPGAFTGAAVQNNYPVFYKEACKHKVWPSASGAHQITTVTMPGVQKGCQNSISVLEGAVFYKAPSGVFMDDGGGAVEIGQSLGNVPYRDASGAIHEGKYYMTMLGADNRYHLFVYDIDRRMWHREKGMSGTLASGGGSLYAVSSGDILDLSGNTGTLEEAVSWMAVTGDLGLELPEQKYITRLTLRLSLDPGATLEIYAQYDREQAWVKLGQVYGTDLRSFSLPVRPRRCDQLRLKLQGKGMCKLYSITKTLGKGSEL